MTLSNNDYTERLFQGVIELSKYQTIDQARDHIVKMRELIINHRDQNWLDALSKYQIMSKMSLVEDIMENFGGSIDGDIYILGGWLGTLTYFLNMRGMKPDGRYLSIDTDESLVAPATDLNIDLYHAGKFKAITDNMYHLNYTNDFLVSKDHDGLVTATPGLIINTCCEHLADYKKWINDVPPGIRIALQSNNMYGIEDHVNCVPDLDTFERTCGVQTILTSRTLELGDTWKRFTIIGIT